MESFGEYLKAQREKRSIRLEEIASITKIQLHNLELLEKGNWENLPPEPFIRGFILAYAKYVGLNPREVIQKYETEHGLHTAPAKAAAETPSEEEFPKSDEEEDSLPPEQVVKSVRHFPTKKVATAAAGVVVLLLVGRLALFGKKVSEETNKAPEVIASAPATQVAESAPIAAAPVTEPAKPVENPVAANTQPAAAPTAPAASNNDRIIASQKEIPKEQTPATPQSNTTAAAAVTSTAAPAAKDPAIQHEVDVTVKERSWAKIVIDDEKPVQTILKKGEKVNYKAKSKIKVVLGNSTGAEFLHNGEPSEGKVYQGTIRYYIFPHGARFPQDPPKPRAVSSDENTNGASAEEKKETPESSDNND
jgi:cytoskeletal protein RodZ